MMIVYGELLVIENMVIGAVLLDVTGRICSRGDGVQHSKQEGKKGSLYIRLRFAAGSIMCGAFSLVVFLNIKAPLMILMEIFFAVAVCTVAFGKESRHAEYEDSGNMIISAASKVSQFSWHRALVFILITYFMGGITMGLLLLTENQGMYTAVGIYTGDMKAAMLVIFIWAGYVTAIQVIKTVRKRKIYTEHSYEVRIVCGDSEIVARAFLDTGNRLKEPMSGRSAAIASEKLWEHMQSCGFCSEERFSVIPYETVGGRGLLEAVRVDFIDAGAGCVKGCFVARSNGRFSIKHDMQNGSVSENTGYELLIPAEMAAGRF